LGFTGLNTFNGLSPIGYRLTLYSPVPENHNIPSKSVVKHSQIALTWVY